MDNEGTSVTLIFYKVGAKWWREPLLNIVASFAQMSDLTHVEIAIGEHAGQAGEMKNVCRVFNDKIGVVKKNLACPPFSRGSHRHGVRGAGTRGAHGTQPSGDCAAPRAPVPAART